MEKDFQFFNKLPPIKKKDSHSKFKWMQLSSLLMIVTASSFLVVVTAASVHMLNPKNKGAETSYIAPKNAEIIKTQILEQQKILQETYLENKNLLNQYVKYDKLLQTLNYEAKYKFKNNENEKLYINNYKILETDFKVIDVLTDPRQDLEVKKFLISNNNTFQSYDRWVTKKDDSIQYTVEIVNLNKEIKKDLKFLELTQDEVTKAVKKATKP